MRGFLECRRPGLAGPSPALCKPTRFGRPGRSWPTIPRQPGDVGRCAVALGPIGSAPVVVGYPRMAMLGMASVNSQLFGRRNPGSVLRVPLIIGE